MKSTFFAVIGLLFATLSFATPTATTPNPSLQRRTCGSGQFFYAKKNCCLQHGGPKECPKPPKGKDCPPTFYFHPGHNCCVPKFPTPPNYKPDCSKAKKTCWNSHSDFCEDQPQPLVSPNVVYTGAKSIYDKYNSNHGKWPRELAPHVKKAKQSRTQSLCPKGLEACPIYGLSGEFECVDPVEDIRACGGCPAFGKGQDCTAIPFAIGVGCSAASLSGPSCVVTSCSEGYQPSADAKSCVAL